MCCGARERGFPSNEDVARRREMNACRLQSVTTPPPTTAGCASSWRTFNLLPAAKVAKYAAACLALCSTIVGSTTATISNTVAYAAAAAIVAFDAVSSSPK
jgi:hypothetical protein